MRDVLAGGVLVQAGSPAQPFRFSKARPRRRLARRFGAVPRRAAKPSAQAAATQPGQLSSPHLTSGFGSLSVH